MRYLDLLVSTPLQHVSSGHLTSGNRFIHDRRTLGTHVLIILAEGTLYMEQNRTQYILTPGQAMLLLANEEHFGFRESDAGLSYYWCHFTPRAIGDLLLTRQEANDCLEGAQGQRYLSSYADRLLCPECFHCKDVSRLVIHMKQLLHITNSNAYMRYAADYCLTGLMIELSSQFMESRGNGAFSAQQPRHGQMKRLTEVLEWIRVHRHEPMTASMVAERFGYNADYLSSLIKQHTGHSLIRYIHRLKISEAREKLLSTDLSVQQIAFALGFQDEKYFMRLFRMHEGISPGKYRAAFFRTHTNNK